MNQISIYKIYSILNSCEIINMARPTKTAYNKCLTTKIPADMSHSNITNIKKLPISPSSFRSRFRLTIDFLCDLEPK